MAEAPRTLAAGRLRAAVSPLGAELRSFSVDGRDLLWNADPQWWGSSAPLLFPIVGAVNGGEYRLDGHAYALPKHGFARRGPFTLAEAGEDFAVFRLGADDATRAVYPFEFQLDVRFQLAGETLAMTATVANLGATPMPASFGFHPAFNWPLDPAGDRLAHRIVFDRLEPAPIRRLTSDGLLAPEPLASPVEGHTLLLADALFAHDALIFDQPSSRGLVYGAPGGAGLRIDYTDLPHLGVWTKPGAPYVCIEPWQGVADPEGYEGEFRDKPGVIMAAPGQTRVFSMSVTVLDRID